VRVKRRKQGDLADAFDDLIVYDDRAHEALAAVDDAMAHRGYLVEATRHARALQSLKCRR